MAIAIDQVRYKALKLAAAKMGLLAGTSGITLAFPASAVDKVVRVQGQGLEDGGGRGAAGQYGTPGWRGCYHRPCPAASTGH